MRGRAIDKPKRTSRPGQIARTVQRTRRDLRVALVDLVHERGWDAVTVKDVCTRANIGRSTLYVHFADKEELLFSGFADLATALERSRATAPGTFAFAERLIAHVQGDRPLFLALATRPEARRIISSLRAIASDLTAAELAVSNVPHAKRAALAAYITSALVDTIARWLEQPTHESAVTIAERFVTTTRVLIEASRA